MAELTGKSPDKLGSRDCLLDASILWEYIMNTKVQKSQIAESLRNLVAAYSKALAHLEDALTTIP